MADEELMAGVGVFELLEAGEVVAVEAVAVLLDKRRHVPLAIAAQINFAANGRHDNR